MPYTNHMWDSPLKVELGSSGWLYQGQPGKLAAVSPIERQLVTLMAGKPKAPLGSKSK